MDTLQDLLLTFRMTKAEKQIAEYWLAHRQDAGYLTMRELADRLVVSDMTVLRFVRKLGFGNYAEFVRDYLRENTEFAQRTDLVSAVCRRGTENLQAGLGEISEEQLESVVQLLLRCHRRYIAGFQLNSCCAAYLARKLQCYLRYVTLFQQEDSSQLETMAEMGPEDCLVLFSFAPYTRMNGVLLKIAKAQGTSVVVVTDRPDAPVAALANQLFVLPVEGAGGIKSYVAPISLAEAVLIRVSRLTADLNNDRTPLLDEYMKWFEE